MNPNQPSMLKPALIGGAAAGALGALPLVGALNCCCCLLVVAGGFFAAFLQSNECRKLGVPFGPSPGALVGLVAAIFYWLVNSVVGGLIRLAVGPEISQIREQLEQMEERGIEMPPESWDVIDWLANNPGMFVAIGVGATLVAALVFSTIGGLIGGMAFKHEPPPPPIRDTAPPLAPPPPPPLAGGHGTESPGGPGAPDGS